MQNPGPDVHEESDDAKDNTNDIHCVVTVMNHLASTAAVDTPLLVCLNSTREGLCDERALELGLQLGIAGLAGSVREGVDKAKDEESREGAAQVGNTARNVSKYAGCKVESVGKLT